MKKEEKKALLSKEKSPKQIADDSLADIKKLMDENKALTEQLEKKDIEPSVIEKDEEEEEEEEEKEETDDKNKIVLNPLSDTGLFRSELLVRLDLIAEALGTGKKK